MDAVVSLGLVVALFLALRWIHLQMLPGMVHGVERLGWAMVRIIWTNPVRQHGVARTVWLWSVAGALLLTIAALLGGEASGLAGAAGMWVIVLAGWWALRWWARRRYRPRPLPERRRRRR